MTSIRPEATASTSASRSSSVRSGGDSFQECPVGADVVFVQRDVIDRDGGADGQSGVARALEDFQRLDAAQRRRVIAAAGQRHEPHVALQHDRLGRVGNADQPQPRGEFALVHDAFADQMGVFGVVHDQRVEVAGVGQRPAHHLGIGDAPVAVGERHGAGGLQQADLGHFRAAHALGQRRHRMDVDDRGVAGAAQDEVHRRRIVDHRRGIGLADDGGDAAGGGGLARGRKGFAVAGAGLADKGAHVDQPGCDDPAGAIDDVGAFGHAGRADAAAAFADGAVGDQHVADPVEIPGGIDQAGVGEQHRAAVGQHVHAFGRLRASASSTAIRTATPISTCSRISDCAPSATIESISTPRFIGPGCITSASGLA